MHESIGTHLPFRVEFYEHWLQPPRLQGGTVGLPSFLAVLSFLRQEGAVYDAIVADAGRHAADWVFADVATFSRVRWRWLPRGRRFKAALRLTQRLIADATPATRTRIRWRRLAGRLSVTDSPFCNVRATAPAPLCGFYAAALARFCELLGVTGEVAHAGCHAMGDDECVVTLAPGHPAIVEDVASKPGIGL